MSKNEEFSKRSIWHKDLSEYKAFRCVLWIVYVPFVMVMFVSVAAIFGVVTTTAFFVCTFASVWLYERWQDQNVATSAISSKQRLPKTEIAKWQMYNAFDDYWYLRGYFVRLVLDVKVPIEGPWYDRDIIRWFIELWESPWLVDSICMQLEQVGKNARADRDRVIHLHTIADRVGKTFDGCSHSAEEVETIRSFFDEVATTLISIDQWFAESEWPDNFQPSDIWDEFNNSSIETANKDAPFRDEI